MKHHLFLLCVLLALTSVKVAYSEEMKVEVDSNCECGLFNNQTVNSLIEKPVGSKKLQFNVACNDTGREDCKNMCKALAETSKHQDGIQKLCAHLGMADKFVPKLYYRLCNETNWYFTGGPSTIEVCCMDKKIIPCNTNSTKLN